MNRPGQVLTELVIALSVVIIGVMALVQLATKSISNAGYSKRQSVGTSYASSGADWVRGQRDSLGWDQFVLKVGQTYCINDLLTWTPGPCSNQIGTTGYSREVALTALTTPTPPLTTDKIEAIITVKWSEGVNVYSSKQSTIFGRYGGVALASLPTPTPVIIPLDPIAGTGADGACSVTSGTTNVNTASCAGRFTADAVNFSVVANTVSGQNLITLSSSPTGLLAVGNEVLIINLQGTSGDNSNVGKYETKTITAINTNTLTLNSNLTNAYNGTTQKIMVQRVPNYTSVTVNAGMTLTANAWNGTKGGAIFFRATGTVTVNSSGSINTNSLGYRGGAATNSSQAGQGESIIPAGSSTSANNGGGGGGISTTGCHRAGGGGGGYGAAGRAGTLSGTGTVGAAGGTYGVAALTTMFLGSGGGGSSGASCDPGTSAGGKGGGIIFIGATTISVAGTISANGQNSAAGSPKNSATGGGGSGGSVYLAARGITGSSLVSAAAGSATTGGVAPGGNGGVGRIRIETI